MALYLVGGGPSQATGPVIDRFVEAARQRGPRVAIAILGAQSEAGRYLDMYADPILARWPQALIEPIWLVDEDEGAVDWPAKPEELGGLIIAGGWTPGYLDALTPYRETISRLVRGGLAYLGFSAGAQVVAKRAIASGWQWRGRAVGPEVAGEGSTELTVREGLGLVGPSIDVHTNTQHLLERAIATVLAGHATSAVAIDEDTALVVDTSSGDTEVVGAGAVHWLNRDGNEVRVRVSVSGGTPASPLGAAG
ncbi:cyanophycinase [Propionibacterium cyclohexanicum]|uniref:Cyanophycinase n=1 Tax=Propionibacterium cyclohexanicum TaxID=64702 RepID=A0A1H9SFJ4_9ACTN|nr:hypothetical protein [Propionibacterium cyclohexanicum]SER83731.1 cyanophycinase [Propionibacterium cyclohexanicum]